MNQNKIVCQFCKVPVLFVSEVRNSEHTWGIYACPKCGYPVRI